MSRTLVREFALRRGDEVTGRVVPRRPGERHGRHGHRRVAHPARRRPSASTTCRCSARAARCAPGRRGRVRGAHGRDRGARWRAVSARWSPARRARARRTCCARSARGLVGGEERVIVALVDVRPEEVPEWDLGTASRCTPPPSDRPPREQVALAELALERGKAPGRAAARTWSCVLDSISRLARAYGLARSDRGRRADPGAARRRGRQALVRGGARHGRGLADADRRRARGVRVVARDARARGAASTAAEHGRAARPGAGRARHCTRRSTRAAPARWARRRCCAEDRRAPLDELRGVAALARPGRGLGVRGRARNATTASNERAARAAGWALAPGRRPASRRARATARSAPSRGPAARSRSCACPRGSRCRARLP